MGMWRSRGFALLLWMGGVEQELMSDACLIFICARSLAWNLISVIVYCVLLYLVNL